MRYHTGMSVVPTEERKSPRISRFITESLFVVPSSRQLVTFFVSFLSGLLLIAIGAQILVMKDHQQQKQLLTQERIQIEQQITYWKQMAQKYPVYRDAHYRLAVLEYKLGNDASSQEQLEKVLTIDPNFEQGRVLGAKITATGK